jgi:1,2-diacylglycerol 3-beta-glucosyltransferase
MVLLTVLVAVLALLFLLTSVSDLISLALMPFRRKAPTADSAGQQRLLFLIPAHDEELLIERCIYSFRGLRYPADRWSLVVVADNCEDGTAELARSAGAEVLERHDPLLPGKPRAIEWALGQLPLRDYDSVVIVDADSVVDPDFADALATAPPLRQTAAQGYIDVSNPSDSALTRLAAVFAASKYLFAYRLKSRAGLNVPMMGNGMCIGVDVLTKYGWQAFSICEDWELYAILTQQGIQINNVPGARIYAQEARSLSQTSSQRQRWTAGKITVLLGYGWALLTTPHTTAHQKLDALAELVALGPVAHFAVILVVGVLCLLLSPPATLLLVLLLSASLVRTLTYTAAGLSVVPEPLKTLLSFLYLPVYTVWRLRNLVGAMRMIGDKPWVRTKRHAEERGQVLDEPD